MAKKKAKIAKKVFYKNKMSGMMWQVEPYFAYRVKNLSTGVSYDETSEQVEERLKSKNVEIMSTKAVEVLYGD